MIHTTQTWKIGDCIELMQECPDNHFDLVSTDPPYGYSFMGKDWDKAVPSVDIWQECLRILKPGAFAFIMSAPRQDVLAHNLVNLSDAGFETGFTSIYWTFASGFPKAGNVGKMVDKRNGRNVSPEFKDYINEKRREKRMSLNEINESLGCATTGGGVASAVMGDKRFNELPTLLMYTKLKSLLDLDSRYDALIEREEAEREVIGTDGRSFNHATFDFGREWDITASATPEAKALEGAYTGFSPKPAVEVIMVVMKPLSEKTYVDQALANGKGITWLDDGRIPYQSDGDMSSVPQPSFNSPTGKTYGFKTGVGRNGEQWDAANGGRFPANLLVSDDVLNDGVFRHKAGNVRVSNMGDYDASSYKAGDYPHNPNYYSDDDGDSFSRYFNLDAWFDTKFLPKEAQKTFPFMIVPKASKSEKGKDNKHPTVKPVKLFSWLITIGSREGDLVLDPFLGSGTTLEACRKTNRNCIGFEISDEWEKYYPDRAMSYTPTLQSYMQTGDE